MLTQRVNHSLPPSRVSYFNLQGFTLIEILIVLLIISIMTTIGLLNINYQDERQIKIFANDLQQAIILAEDQARLLPAIIGLRISEDHYEFLLKEPHPDQETSWQTINDSSLKPKSIPNFLELNLIIDDQRISTTAADKPQILISNNGDLTPFTLTIGYPGKSALYQITGRLNGEVLISRL